MSVKTFRNNCDDGIHAAAKKEYRKPLKTSVFGGFLTPWRKLRLRNLLYGKELAIFSAEPLETQPGFPEVPYIAKNLN
jgi:hypothetical protein